MKLKGRQITILGSGIAGLAAAEQLGPLGPEVVIIEHAATLGGHAARFSCKAVDECVRCGACAAQGKLRSISCHPNVRVMVETRVARVEYNDAIGIELETTKRSGAGHTNALRSDALLVATGFQACDPRDKPYGYGRFPDVVTNLEAEAILKSHGKLKRPSDDREPKQIAFIQCVGSRDSRIHHPWCSKICCGSALRMARLIQYRQPDIRVTFFYIDVQTFGKNFQAFYDHIRSKVEMIRTIPGDIFATADQRLMVTYFDPQTQKATETEFDMVILSVGIAPSEDNAGLARMLNWPMTPWGFFQSHRQLPAGQPGVFIAGTALGPMSIAESIDSAGQAAWDIAQYLNVE